MSESLYSTQTHWTREYENFFYDYDVKEIPLYENQEGYWRDLELVESIWKLKPDIESPQTFSEPPTPAMVQDTIVCTPENKTENKPDDVLEQWKPRDSTCEQVFCTKETKNRSQL